jgi:catechol 2,3-dioxygenase-like lactoylglutathione lyase family enzyme
VHELGNPVQIAYAVPDARAAAARWAAATGAGPFLVRPHIELASVRYRDRAATFDHTSAYGQWGPVMLELIEVHSTAPNIVSDVLGDRPTGLHHLAFWVDDLDRVVAALAARGHLEAMRATTAGGVMFVFVDAVEHLGHMIELYRPDERLRRFYADVAAAADGWDGSDPVRER